MKLADLKIGKRMGIGFGLLILCMFVGTAIAFWGIASVNASMDEALKETEELQLAQGISDDLDGLYLNIWHLCVQKTAADMQEHKAKLEQARTAYREKIEELKKSNASGKGRELVDKLEAAVLNAKDVNNKILVAL